MCVILYTRSTFAISTLLLALLCGLCTSPTASRAGETSGNAVGRSVPDVELLDLEGETRLLSDFFQGLHQGTYEHAEKDVDHSKRFVALIFLGTQCPIGNQYIPVLNELQAKYAEHDVQLLGVNSNRGDSLEEVAKHVKEFEIAFPVVKDPRGDLARALGVKRMTETLLLGPQRIVHYHGRIDDRFGYSHKRDEPRRRDLVEALDEVLASTDVSVTSTDVSGCLITLPKQPHVTESLTYHADVAKIVVNKCQNCHHEGTAAPFALESYDDVVNWQEMVREVVLERRMPAWHADPRYGEFTNDRRLTQAEIDTLVAWIDQGAVEGEASEASEPREYATGWMIGEPDIVIEGKQFEIPATGVVPYKYFVTETNFEEDVWIQAAEAQPGNRAVVHHIIAFHFIPSEDEGKPKVNPASPRGWICGTAPGDMPLILPEGVALKIPKGSQILWQMHFTPTGKKEVDTSRLGLKLYDQPTPPQHVVHKTSAMNTRFVIPPGESNYPVVSKKKLPTDVRLLSFMPHMHLRGKDFLYRARYPDGRVETLLSVPRYDFNWQTSYRFKNLPRLPAGTVLECVAHFDNSLDNPANPADPPEEVRWGEQTWEEMMIGYVNYISDVPDGPGAEGLTAEGRTAQKPTAEQPDASEKR